MKERYILYIEYLGTNYAGWQRQPNQLTVQEVIENVLTRVLQEEITIYGQGRTDAGVHAKHQIAHFDSSKAIYKHKLTYAFLGLLPRDISIWSIQKVDPGFHARFDAIERQYQYQIITRPSAFSTDRAELILNKLNISSMQKCAEAIIGKNDFRNFSKENDDTNCICYINCSYWEQNRHHLTYTISANRFRRHLVRRLVGTMVEVGLGKKTVHEFKELKNKLDTNLNPFMAAAKGLTLTKVFYGDGIVSASL